MNVYSDSSANISTRPPCETVLQVTNEQFKAFAARVAAVSPIVTIDDPVEPIPICALCGVEQSPWPNNRISRHADDCAWVEAQRLVAMDDEGKENKTAMWGYYCQDCAVQSEDWFNDNWLNRGASVLRQYLSLRALMKSARQEFDTLSIKVTAYGFSGEDTDAEFFIVLRSEYGDLRPV